MKIAVLAVLMMLSFSGSEVFAAELGFPFSRHQEYAKGTIRVSAPVQAVQDAEVLRYYERWKADYLVRVEEGKWRVAFGKSKTAHKRTVSEGQGYGMLILAIMVGEDAQAREIFDGLWRFARAHPSAIDGRLMAWEVPPVDEDSQDSACDGDLDIAYGLLLADKQWGNAGAVNYRKEAQTLLAGIAESTIGPESHLPLLGDWVKESDGDSRDGKYTQWQTRPSDFMTGHFRAFGRLTGHSEWSKMIAATQKITEKLQDEYSAGTGLLPDFVVLTDSAPQPAPPKFLEEKSDGAYSYNACRTPWRLGTDALLNGDAASRRAALRMSHWIEQTTAGDPQRIRSGYELDGRPLPHSGDFSIGFAAPFAVAAMLDPGQQKWLDALYAAIREAHENYYEDSITLLSLLVITGHFWDPTLVN